MVDAKDGVVLSLPRPGERNVWPGGLAWAGTRTLLLAQPESAAAAQTGTGSRIVALDVSSREARTLFSSPANTLVFDVLGPGRLVLGARSLRQNLRQVSLRAQSGRAERWLTRGNATDRQPVESPDGEWIVFSSNRSGNLDVWALHVRSGALRRLTDHAGDDFDPAFAPDGRLIWSSNRSGNFEVWMANADGAAARQVTRDGVDAENPAPTPDGRFIVYASGNPRSRGILKIATGGGEATLVAGGNLILPEVSPDGRHVAFVADQGSENAALRVVRLEDGAPTGFEVPLPPWIPGGSMDQGRCRWFPDGRAIAYVGRAADGGYAVYVREFAAGARGPGRRLAGLEPDLDAESFAIAPDGASLIVSYREELDDLMLAESLAGVERPRLGP
jgi:Tol biopolymer transport system component